MTDNPSNLRNYVTADTLSIAAPSDHTHATVATHKGELIGRRLVITFVPTTSRTRLWLYGTSDHLGVRL